MLGFPRNQHAKICADPFVEGPCVVIRILTHIFRTPSRLDVQKGNPNKGGDVPTNLCKHFKKLLY